MDFKYILYISNCIILFENVIESGRRMLKSFLVMLIVCVWFERDVKMSKI